MNIDDIKQVLIVGSGIMGKQNGFQWAGIGYDVILYDISQNLLDKAMDRLKLSARAYHRILKLARTIADISNSEHIETPHLTEAISYRSLDRFINN